MEGLCSPKATPNLDIASRGPNHTTTLLTVKTIAKCTKGRDYTKAFKIRYTGSYIIGCPFKHRYRYKNNL